jgi:hypothetical protein
VNQFKGKLKVESQTLCFVFNRILTSNGEKFFIKVNKNRVPFSFDMKKDKYDKWKIVEPAPKWVRKVEEKLIKAINRHR